MSRRIKIVLWLGVAGFALIALGVTFWLRTFQRYTPAEAVQDLRAAAMARNAPRPIERFLEVRYGPLTEPANRQKAFLDFFNVGHIEGLHLIVKRMPGERREGSIHGMAQWISQYRETLSAEEKAALNAYLQTEVGRRTVQQATAKYLSHDVRYRAATAPVIAELMATLATVQKQ